MSQNNEEKEKIWKYLSQSEVASVGTSDMGAPRQRMMHFAVAEDLTLYLTSMKGDPKVIQWINTPQTSILVHRGASFMEMEECEITGRSEIIPSEKERITASELLALKSPIVRQMKEIGALDRLEFIKIVPYTIKYRFVPDILQGQPPTVIDFPQHRAKYSEWQEIIKRVRVWKEAIRPLSLTATLIPILLGSFMALALYDRFSLMLFIFTLLGGLLIQIGTNMINDWKDAEADALNVHALRPFSGGSRVVQLGLISRAEIGFVGILLSLVAFFIGIGLTLASGIGILPLIIYGFIAGFFYTGGKGKFSFINLAPGVAEIILATTYGVFMTVGAYFVQTQSYSVEVFLVSITVAFFVTNVLIINQFADLTSDKQAGKKTLVVRLGKKNGRYVLLINFIGGYAWLVFITLSGLVPIQLLWGLLSIPFAYKSMATLYRHLEGTPIDLAPSNAHTAMNHLANGCLLLFAYSLLIPYWQLSIAIVLASVLFIIWIWRYIERQRKISELFRSNIQKQV
jgi:1,4-dihydroxy-2-naphthoate octaprenyltransferase